MKKLIISLLLVPAFILSTEKVSGINPGDTRMMSQPVISRDHIAFIYAEDLWIADRDGSQPVRLTVDEGIEYF